MRKGRRLGLQSALLVSYGVIGLSFLFSLLAWWLGLSGAGALLTVIGVVGLAGRLWGNYSLNGVTAEITPERSTLSVGESTEIAYSIVNAKALPLVWLEICQDIPRGECLRPLDGFTRRSFTPEEAERTGKKEAYMRRFSFISAYGSLKWETEWKAEHRGVVKPDRLVFRSGDGFGLSSVFRQESDSQVAENGGRLIVVWPRLVPVDVSCFLKNVWTGDAGKSGWAEDLSVVRGERAYQPGDPWKRIDWRTAARTDELMVRQYDTVTPQSILFVIDLGSFSPEKRENVISVIASVIRELEYRGISCGLALPETAEAASTVLRPGAETAGLHACMYALSVLDAEHPTGKFDRSAVLNAAADSGQTWVVAAGAGSTSYAEMLYAMKENALRLLCERREPGILFSETVLTEQVQKGGGNT